MKKIISIVFLFIAFSLQAQIPTKLTNGIVTRTVSDPVSNIEGWLIYNTTSNEYKYNDGTQWVAISPQDLSNYVTFDGTNIFTGTGNTFTNGLNVIEGLTINTGGLNLAGNLSASLSTGNFASLRVDLDPYNILWAGDDSVPTKQDVYNKIESLVDFSGDYNDLSNLPDLTDYATITTAQAITGQKTFITSQTFSDNLILDADVVLRNLGIERRISFGSGTSAATYNLPDKVGTYTIATLSDISSAGISEISEDTTPVLGGNLDIAGFNVIDNSLLTLDKEIVSTSSNTVFLGNDDNTMWLLGQDARPAYNGAFLAMLSDIPTLLSELTNDSGYLLNTVEDTTPQAGGDFDLNDFKLIDNSLLTLDRTVIETSNGLVEIGSVDNSMNLRGDLTRPRYNSNELALLTDVSSFDTTANYTTTGTWTFEGATTLSSTDFSGSNVTGVPDPAFDTEPVNLRYFNANTPSNAITPVVVTDSTYTFLEADLLASKTHLFNVVADTITITIPAITLPANEQIFATVKAINDNPIKLVPSASVNQVEYLIKDVDEAVSISSYVDDQWFKWRNVTSSVYTAPIANIILNGTFDDASNLVLGAGYTVSGGELVLTHNGSTQTMQFDLSANLTESTAYTLQFEVTSGTARLRTYLKEGVGDGTLVDGYTNWGVGTHTVSFTTGAATSIEQISWWSSSAGGSFTIDNVILTAD